MRRFVALLLALVLFGPVAGWAADAPPTVVGRVSFLDGKLAFHMPGESQWSGAAVNYPVAAGASFWTAPRARTEFRIGPQSIAVADDTAVEFIRLDRGGMQLALKQGRINVHLRQAGDRTESRIDLPRGTLMLLEPGIYDVNAGRPDEPSRIAVFAGRARFTGDSVDLEIKAGDMAVIGGAETLTVSVERAGPDEFAEWCRSRDDEPRKLTAKHVSPRMTGYEELAASGSWRTVPRYGEVWVPSAVPAGWAPYRDGSWVWVQPWGWTWVDAQPWGFAPSHYGRWAYVDDYWAWVPGPLVEEPVYAPALVAFVDAPAGLAAGSARGPLVGWIPLGPDEPYWPWYTDDRAYIAAVNAGFVSDPAAMAQLAAAAVLANRAAATVVPERVFAGARPVAPAALRVSGDALQWAALAATPPGLRQGRHRGAARAGWDREAAALAGPGRGRVKFAGRQAREAAATVGRPPRIARSERGPGNAHAKAPHRGGARHVRGHHGRGGGHKAAGKGGGKHFGGGRAHHFGFAQHGGGRHSGGGMRPGGDFNLGAGGGGHGGKHGGGKHGGGHGGGHGRGHGGGGHGHGGGKHK